MTRCIQIRVIKSIAVIRKYVIRIDTILKENNLGFNKVRYKDWYNPEKNDFVKVRSDQIWQGSDVL